MRTMMLGVVVLAVASLACPRPRVADRRECPHDWVWDSLWQGKHWNQFDLAVDASGNKQLAVPGALQNIPEFHDCQRFIVASDTGRPRYDSLFAIFASFVLDTLFLDTIPSVIAKPAAEIYAEGAYQPLGIAPQLNCLFLNRGSDGWRAKMVPVGGNDARCRTSIPFAEITAGTPLEVRAMMVPGLADSDYAPVARWDWDPQNRQQYIGIKCGAAWCEVGAHGFVASAAHPERVTTGMSNAERRIYEVKGWYDEQYLAVRAGNRTVPSSILGTVFPDQHLGRYRDADFAAATGATASPWLPGAQAMLVGGTSAELNTYRQKLGFQPTQEGGPLNPIGLCTGSSAACKVPSGMSAIPSPGGNPWWARIGTSSGKHLPVTRCNLDIDPPGTARWRWSVRDEGVWMRCTKGCCEVVGP